MRPPDNFAVVEPGLYRASLPHANNFSFIRSLCLKRVILLAPERPQKIIVNLLDEHKIHLAHTGLHAWTSDTSWKPMAEEVVKESLEMILTREYYPMMVCDVGGRHLVGMVIGCLRRLQNWNFNSVITEYRTYAGPRTRYVNEQFIELFDIDLVTIPHDPPAWFAEQVEMDRQEREEFADLLNNNKLTESGALVDRDKSPSYICYYYSSSGPLNSETGGLKPRIQIL